MTRFCILQLSLATPKTVDSVVKKRDELLQWICFLLGKKKNERAFHIAVVETEIKG